MKARAAAAVMVGLFLAASSLQAQEEQIKSAESAAPPSIAADATIMDGEGNVLREGTNGWTCMVAGFGPVCLDAPWMNWLEAYMGKTEPTIATTGFAYMLQGGAEGGSNTDPYATEATADNEWLPPGGPHIMVVVPDAAALEGLPTHPDDGGPWVMYRGTPFAHIMVPIED
jgi:hypothetical protein